MPRQDLLPDGILGMFLGSSSALCNKPGSVSGNPFLTEIKLSGNLMLDFSG